MTSKRFSELLDQLFASNQSECARALGYNSRQIRRWVAGESVPDVVAMLLETMAAKGISAEKARNYAKL